MPQNGPDQDDLRALGSQLDEIRRRDDVRKTPPPPPTSLGVAVRFSTELIAALVVGAGIGWGIDRVFHTTPVFILVLSFMGAAAGVINVVRAAKEINAQIESAQKRNEEK
jgi:ATP synthase protein I